MRTPLVMAALLAISVPVLAAPDDAIRSDTAPQAITANDTAVATGANVQTAQAAQRQDVPATQATEDSPPAGPEKAQAAPAQKPR